AQHEALAFAHPWIGTEHLLLGVLAADTPGVALLAEAGVTLSAARLALDQFVGRGGFCERDAAALLSVGIDLAQVRHAAKASFGPSALDRAPVRRCRRRSLFGQYRQQRDATTEKLPFMPRAKRALKRASMEAGAAGTTSWISTSCCSACSTPKATWPSTSSSTSARIPRWYAHSCV